MNPIVRIGPGIDMAAIVLCVAFLAYVLAILWPYLRRSVQTGGDHSQLSWHLIVPCLDEERVIARTVARLRLDHADAHIWCVDDASADRTPGILAALSAADERIHVVSRRKPDAQVGKGPALNAGWAAIRAWLPAGRDNDEPGSDEPGTDEPGSDSDESSVIVGVVDADGRLAPGALDMLAGPRNFGSPDVGAVQIQVRMLNRGLSANRPDGDDPRPAGRWSALLVQLQDLEFRTVIAAMQHLRHRIGSVGMGGNGQFTRLTVLNRIAGAHGSPWHGALLEDFELGLHVLLVGSRNEYCDDTWVSQEGLPTCRTLIRQRTRWAQGGMQCSKYIRPILGSRNISTPAALEICYFLLIPWTQLIGTLVYSLAIASIGYYAATTANGFGGWVVGGGWGLIPLLAAFGVAPLAVWGLVYRRRCEPQISVPMAILLGLAYWLYTYLMVAAVWCAFARLLRSENRWVKTGRVLQNGVPSGFGSRHAALPGSASRAPDHLVEAQ